MHDFGFFESPDERLRYGTHDLIVIPNVSMN